MNPNDSNEDQNGSKSANVDKGKPPQKQPSVPNDQNPNPTALGKNSDGDIKKDDDGPGMDSIANGQTKESVNSNTEFNLMDILGEEQDDKIKKLLLGVCRALQREYGDIANSAIYQFIAFVREHEYNVDLEILTEELQCTVSESEFIEHFATEFPSVFDTESEKQKLQNLFSSARFEEFVGDSKRNESNVEDEASRDGMWSMSILETIWKILYILTSTSSPWSSSVSSVNFEVFKGAVAHVDSAPWGVPRFRGLQVEMLIVHGAKSSFATAPPTARRVILIELLTIRLRLK